MSNIVREFHERWGTDWTNAHRVQRFLFEDLPQEVGKDEEYQNAKSSRDQQNARITYEKKLEDKFQDHIFDQTELSRMFTEKSEFRKWLVIRLFAMDYRQAAG